LHSRTLFITASHQYLFFLYFEYSTANMVRLSSAFGLAALVSCTVAAPAAATTFQHSEMEMEARDTSSGFSFEAWVNGIIADPEGDHLSPAEAVAAAQEAAGELSPSDTPRTS
jgi:hypothetical protein